MQISDIIEIISIITSLFTSIVAIIISVKTLKQSEQTLEETTRPYVCVYGQSINPGSPQFYLVVKNFGASPAHMTKFTYTPDLSNCYDTSNPSRNFLTDLSKGTLAPGQSKICKLKYSSVPEKITFDLEYHCGKKDYHETFTTDIKAGVAMPTTKIDTSNKELRTISYTLQEMLQKDL